MSSFTPAGSGGAPLSPITIQGATTPTIANVPMATAATEYSYVLPANTIRFMILLRPVVPAGRLKLAYAAGTSGTTYVTLGPGVVYGEDTIDASALTLYFQSNLSGQVAEIVSWV